MAETLRYAQIVRPVSTPDLPDRDNGLRPDAASAGYVNGLTRRIADALGQSNVSTILPHDGKIPLNFSAKMKAENLPEGHKDIQSHMREELSGIVAEHLAGVDLPSAEGERVIQMAPALTKALLGSSMIDGIQSTHALEAIRWSLECAKEPSLIGRTVIRTGFGGSDDEDITMRYATYAIPALDVWSRLDEVRKERKQAALKRRANYSADHEIDPETEERFRREAGVFDMPQIEYFSAHHAAIEINGMDAKKASANALRGQRLIEAYAERFYPDAAKKITFRTDSPLEINTPDGALTNEGLVVTYIENLLERYDGADVQRVLEKLGGRGRNHATTDITRAELYSALHPLIFGDRMEVPTVGHTMPKDTAAANISIGGRPERLFNEIRTLISEKAEAGDFVTYASERYAEGLITDDQMQHISRWARVLEARRTHYEKDGIAGWQRPDLPAITVPLLTPVGDTPVYYSTLADVPLNAENLRSIREASGIDTYYDALTASARESATPPTQNDFIKIGHAVKDLGILMNRPNKKGERKLKEDINDESVLAFFEDFIASEEAV